MASTQHKWQSWAVPLLMGLNILFLGFMLWQQTQPQSMGPQGPRKNGNIKSFLVKELNLNDTQQAEYEALIQDHQNQNKATHQRLRLLMDKQIEMISQGKDEAEIELLAQEFGSIHADMIRENAAHFNSIREILNAEQQEKFKGLLKEVMQKMGPGMGPGARHRPPPKR